MKSSKCFCPKTAKEEINDRRHLTEKLDDLLDSFKEKEDPILEMVKILLVWIMETEVSRKVDSDNGEHNAERFGYRSGYRKRRFNTRLGTIDLNIPKLRKGGYEPSFLKCRQRSEEALISAVVEAYKNGVSTRKIRLLAESLGVRGISAGEVSEMNKRPDGMVRDFRTRPLKEE